MSKASFTKLCFVLLTFAFVGVSNASAASLEVTPENPANQSLVEGQVWINASATDDGSIESRSYAWTSAGGNITSYQQFNDTFNTSDIDDGVYNITFRVVDNENKSATAKLWNVTINNTAESSGDPQVNVLSPEESSIISGEVNINVTAMDPDGGDITNLSYRWVNESVTFGWTALNNSFNTSFLSEDSTYDIEVIAKDDNGGSSYATVSDLTVNNSADGGSSVSVDNFRVRSDKGIVFFSFDTSQTVGSYNVSLERDGVVKDYIYNDSTGGDATSFKGSFDGLDDNTTYDVSIESVDGSEVNKEMSVTTGSDDGGDDGGTICCEYEEDDSGGTSYNVDDSKKSTSTSYPTPVAFIGNVLNVTYASGSFNLTGPAGDLIGFTSSSGTFNTSNATEGRHDVYNTSSGAVSTSIDLVNASKSDVVSRIANMTNPEVKVYSYMRAEPIENSSVSVSGVNSSWGGTGEHLFRMNTSLDRYWVQVTGDDGVVSAKSRLVKGDKEFEDDDNTSSSSGSNLTRPFVQDFQPSNRTGNLTGFVKEDNSSVQDLEIRLERFRYDFDRSPFLTSPPKLTALTNSTGGYSFENIPEGDYRLSVTNESFVNAEGYSARRSDVYVSGNTQENLRVTSDTGTLNFTLDAPGSDFYYGYYLISESSSDYKEFSGIGIGNGSTNITLPAGEYSVEAIRFKKDAEFPSPTSKQAGTVTISSGQVTDKSAEFAKTVYLNGTINKNLEDEGWVSIESQSGFTSYFAEVETGEGNWDFSKKVAQNRNYSVKFYPPYESPYVEKNQTVQVNDSAATVSFNLETGKYLSGNIKANGEGIDAYVSVSNYSKDIYGSAEAEDGSYNITGLKEGSYEINVYPENPRYSTVRDTVTVGSNPNTKDFTDLGKSELKLNGTVKVSGGGSAAGSKVIVSTYEEGISREVQNITSSDQTYSFKLPKNVYYRIKVKPPEGEKIEGKSKSRYLSDDKTINFTLIQPQVFTGVVKKTSGERISGAYVYAYNWSQGSFGSDTTDENGEFELDISGTPHKLEVWPGRKSDLPFKRKNLSASDVQSGSENVTYDTSSYTYLSGVVKDGSGNPVNGSISVWNESERSYDYQRLNRTNGRFNLTGLKNVKHNIWVSAENETLPVKRGALSKKPDSFSDNNKTFTLGGGNIQTKKLVLTVHQGSKTGPAEANVTVANDESQKITNSTGKATFTVRSGGSTSFYLNKNGFQSRVKEINVKTGTTTQKEDVYLNQTQEYKVRINVTEMKNRTTEEGGSDINPPATVVFVSRDNGSAQGGSVTVNSEGDRPFIEYLTTGDYLLTLAKGDEERDIFENKTADIPAQNPASHEETVLLKDQNDKVQYKVWYEVNKQ